MQTILLKNVYDFGSCISNSRNYGLKQYLLVFHLCDKRTEALHKQWFITHSTLIP